MHFINITSGDNGYDYAEVGYDNATGWGSFDGRNLWEDATGDAALPPPSPEAPTGLTGSPVSDTQVKLSWNAASDAGGPGVAGYKVYQGGALVDTTSGTGTSYTVSGLTPYTVYTFAVSAYDANGATSGQSAGVDVPLPFEIANSTGLLAAGTSAGYTISQGEVPYGQNQYYWTVSAPDGAQVAHAQTGENGYEPACYDDQNGVSQAASGYELQQCMLWASPSVYP